MANLIEIAAELKKRLPYPYVWGQKQNDVWDKHTQFIYETFSWETLLLKMKQAVEKHSLDKRELFNYAANRWFNFWSAVAVEQIFSELKETTPAENPKDREKDFYLNGIPFDHKTTVFPKQFNKTIEYAQNNEAELIMWLYKNQSSQQRHHFKNRLFIVVYAKNGEHWKLKADIELMKLEIEKFCALFKVEKLKKMELSENYETLSDIIWVLK